MAGNDVFLYSVPTDADSDDVRLRDPTASGTPAGANFAGTATIVFSQTGTLSAPAKFAGSTSLTFTQSGALRAPATLAGATTVTFTPTGDFVAGAVAGGAVFAGNATITFSTTGDFRAGLTAGAGSAPQRRGGAGHQVRFARYWKGKYAGYFNDIEWVEWLLAALAGEVAEAPKPSEPKRTVSRKIRREVIEPEAYIEKAYPAAFNGLLELKLEELETLAMQRQNAQLAALIEAAAKKKRRHEEEDDIAFMFMAA